MASRAVACAVVVALAGSACGGTTKSTASAPPRPQLTPSLAHTLDAQLREGYANEGIAGVSAAIVFPDGREWSAADGLAVIATKQPMTPNTSMPLDSVTKMATAALALRYAEEGRLRLDDQALVPGVERRSARDAARPARSCRRDAGLPYFVLRARGRPPRHAPDRT